MNTKTDPTEYFMGATELDAFYEERRVILGAWLAEIEIGEPIKAWLAPRLEINPTGLMISIHTINAEPPHAPFRLVFCEHFDMAHVRDKDKFHDLVRGALHRVVAHEVDEALRVNGKDVYNPHKSPRRTRCQHCMRMS